MTYAAVQGLDGVGEAVDALSHLLAGAEAAQREALQQRDAALRHNDELLAVVRELRRKHDHMAQQLAIYRATRKPRRKAPAPAMRPEAPLGCGFCARGEAHSAEQHLQAAGLPADVVDRAAGTRCATCPFFMDPAGLAAGLASCVDCRRKGAPGGGSRDGSDTLKP